MAVLLVVIAMISTGVMLQRQSTLARTVQRDIEDYRTHHFTKGLQETIAFWTNTFTGEDVREAIGQDGHAFDMQVAGGFTIRVSIFDGQGSARVIYDGLSGQRLTDARGIAKALLERAPALSSIRSQRGPALGRAVGPVPVSVAAAPLEVLEAVADYAIEGMGRDDFLRELLNAREGGSLVRNDLTQIAIRAQIDNDDRVRLNRILTTSPELWWVVVDVISPRTGRSLPRLMDRYGGYVLISQTRAGTGENHPWESSSPFLSWERLEVPDRPGA
jgi:hypothetical protein